MKQGVYVCVCMCACVYVSVSVCMCVCVKRVHDGHVYARMRREALRARGVDETRCVCLHACM